LTLRRVDELTSSPSDRKELADKSCRAGVLCLNLMGLRQEIRNNHKNVKDPGLAGLQG
jgi:hypothetical protein